MDFSEAERERLQTLDTEHKYVKRELADHEERLRALERFHWWILGAIGASGIFSSTLTGIIMRFLIR